MLDARAAAHAVLHQAERLAAYALACLFLLGAAIVALNIDETARRIWRATTASASR